MQVSSCLCTATVATTNFTTFPQKGKQNKTRLKQKVAYSPLILVLGGQKQEDQSSRPPSATQWVCGEDGLHGVESQTKAQTNPVPIAATSQLLSLAFDSN